MRSTFKPASLVELQPTAWLWTSRIPFGGLTIIEGDPGCNKSTLLYDLAARISSGREMPDCSESTSPGGVLLLSDEDANQTIRRSLEANSAHLDRVWIYDKTQTGEVPFKLPREIPILEAEIRRNKVALVVFDPIPSFVEGSLNVEQSVRTALSPLANLAERTKTAIVLVRHLRKSGSGTALYRGAGSIALIAAARSSLLIGDNPGDREQRIIAHVKSSLGSLAPSMAFRPVPHSGGLRVEWLERCDYSAEEILSSASSEFSALHEAAYVLYSVLGNGPLWADEAKRLVNRAGITDRTLRRAKQLLMVESKRVGFGKDSQFYWILPDKGDLIHHLQERDLDELADALFNQPPETPPENPGSEFLRFFENLESGEDQDPADWWKRGPDENDTDDGENGPT